MAASNKVVFGLKNVHYAIISTDESGNETYGTPVPLPGAVSLAINREGSVSAFWADDSKYASFDESGAGYSGTLTVAYFGAEHLKALCGWKEGSNGVVYEDSSAATVRFALLYEVSSNISPDRFAFYDCVLSRPESSANTRTDSTDPDTQSLEINMTSHKFSESLSCSKAFCTKGQAAFDSWFNAVQPPAAA